MINTTSVRNRFREKNLDDRIFLRDENPFSIITPLSIIDRCRARSLPPRVSKTELAIPVRRSMIERRGNKLNLQLKTLDLGGKASRKTELASIGGMRLVHAGRLSGQGGS